MLSDPAAASPTFVADVQGNYRCTLTVLDVYGALSPSDSVRISFEIVKPLADAGVLRPAAGVRWALTGTNARQSPRRRRRPC